MRKVAPDLGASLVWFVSYLYQWYEDGETPTNDLDMFLALAPWRRDESWRMAAYEKMIDDGWIGVTLLGLVQMGDPSDPLRHVFCAEAYIKDYGGWRRA